MRHYRCRLSPATSFYLLLLQIEQNGTQQKATLPVSSISCYYRHYCYCERSRMQHSKRQHCCCPLSPATYCYYCYCKPAKCNTAKGKRLSCPQSSATYVYYEVGGLDVIALTGTAIQFMHMFVTLIRPSEDTFFPLHSLLAQRVMSDA